MDLSNTVDILAAIGFAITGIFALIGIFNTTTRRRRSEAEEADSRLISLLKDELAALQRRATEQEANIQQNTTQIEVLTKENAMMRSLLQGHDSETKEYRGQVMMAIKNSDTAVKMIQELAKTKSDTNLNVTKLTATVQELSKNSVATNLNVEKLAVAIERHLQVMEDKA